VRILGEMQAGLVNGEVQTLLSLSRRLQLSFDETELILEKLLRANIVRKLSGIGWSMIRDPEHISVRELSDLFLLDTGALPSREGDAAIHAWFALVMQRMEEPKSMMLQDLIGK
jgi:hypothetical protein